MGQIICEAFTLGQMTRNLVFDIVFSWPGKVKVDNISTSGIHFVCIHLCYIFFCIHEYGE